MNTLSTAAIPSCTYMPLNAETFGSTSIKINAIVPSRATIDSQCVTPRCDGFRNRSTSRIAQVAPRRKSSGSIRSRSWTEKNILDFPALNLGDEQMIDDLPDRGIHQVRKRRLPDAEQQHTGSEGSQHQPFARIDVGQMCDVIIGDL